MSTVRSEGLLGERDRTEPMTADDMASVREQEFLQIALLDQQVRANGGLVVQAGMCTYCGEGCMPRAVYCDAECRAGHELELAQLARQGRAAP